MNNFEQLEREYQRVKDDSLTFIKYFENNSNSIDGLDGNETERHFKLKMNGDYGLCLASSGSTEKAIKVLETYIPKYEKEWELGEAELLTTPYYEHLLWAFGSSLYYTDRLDETQGIFERLVKMQPDNQKYKNWLKGIISKRFSKSRNGLYILIFVWILFDILFAKSMDGELKGVFLSVGVLTIIATGVLELYVFLRKKRVQ